MNHVSSKVILGLAAAALIAAVAATVTSIARRPESETARNLSFALPELRDHVNDVKGLTLTTTNDKVVVTLKRDDQGWKVQEKGGYPADTASLRELLLKLADARLLEAKTGVEQHYGELAVEDVKGPAAKGVLVNLDGLAKPARLIVGNFSAKSGGTFVRRPEERKSWLAAGNLQIDRDPGNWLDKNLVDIGAARIAEIVLTKPGGKPLRLHKEKPDDDTFKLAALPKGREMNTELVGGLASTLSGLTLVDVMPAQAAAAPGEENAVVARYRTFDGLTVEARAWKQDDRHYARFSAALDQPRTEARIKAEQAQAKADYEAEKKAMERKFGAAATPSKSPPLAVTDPAKDRQQRLDELKAEAQRLSQRFAGWTFVIPADKYANMDNALDDILKPATATPALKPSHAPKKAGKR